MFSALGKAVQETDCLHLTPSGEAAQVESNVGFFLLFILKEELKQKSKPHNHPKQTKNVVSNIETLAFMMNMHVGELSQSL